MSDQKRGYYIENRWGELPWWLVFYFSDGRAKVVSRHPSKRSAQTAKRRKCRGSAR